jgi:hypothetical protein
MSVPPVGRKGVEETAGPDSKPGLTSVAPAGRERRKRTARLTEAMRIGFAEFIWKTPDQWGNRVRLLSKFTYILTTIKFICFNHFLSVRAFSRGEVL